MAPTSTSANSWMGETALEVGGGREPRRGRQGARRARRRRQREVEGAVVPGVQVDDVGHGEHRAAARRLDAADARGAAGSARGRRRRCSPSARSRPEPHDPTARRRWWSPSSTRTSTSRRCCSTRAPIRTWPTAPARRRSTPSSTCTPSAPHAGPARAEAGGRASTPKGSLKKLIAKGANPNARLQRPMLGRYHGSGDATLGEGATPFLRAAKAVDLPLMRALLDAGADPDADKEGSDQRGDARGRRSGGRAGICGRGPGAATRPRSKH